jgi:hypothetical protein
MTDPMRRFQVAFLQTKKSLIKFSIFGFKSWKVDFVVEKVNAKIKMKKKFWCSANNDLIGSRCYKERNQLYITLK